jgi:hypothetical protein
MGKSIKFLIVSILIDFVNLLSLYKNLAFHSTGRYIIIKVRDTYEQEFLIQ